MATNDLGESWRDAKPVRIPRKAGAPSPMVTMTGVENDIERLNQTLEDKTTEHYMANRDTTLKLGKWLRHRDKVVRQSMAQDKRTSEDTRDSIARSESAGEGLTGHTLWEAWKLAEGHEKSIYVEMQNIRSRLSALQSVAKSVREISGL